MTSSSNRLIPVPFENISKIIEVVLKKTLESFEKGDTKPYQTLSELEDRIHSRNFIKQDGKRMCQLTPQEIQWIKKIYES